MDAISILLRREGPDGCTKDTCPVSESIYGYAPNLGANAAFLAIFAISAIVHLFQGIRYKTWSFMIAMVLGTAAEAAGEGGRIMLHYDAFSDPGFKLQICLLTFAPAFLAAGLYLTLKHLVLTFGGNLSRLPARWYTIIFISCDVLSLALQGAGGGIASSSNDEKTLNLGNSFMMAGLIFQVVTLVLFGLLAGDYAVRAWRGSKKGLLNPNTQLLRNSGRFKALLAALTVSYVAILIRCVYRVAEMAGGWGNSIMQDEVLFIVLDSLACVIAAVVLNVLHPGRCLDFKLEQQKTVFDGSHDNSGTLEMQPGR